MIFPKLDDWIRPPLVIFLTFFEKKIQRLDQVQNQMDRPNCSFFFRFIAGTSEKSRCSRSEQINNSTLLVLFGQSWRTDLQYFVVLDTAHSKIQWFGFSTLGQIQIDEPSKIPDQISPVFPVSKNWSGWWKKKSLGSSTTRNLSHKCRIFLNFYSLYV